jgi:hypothetical protein
MADMFSITELRLLYEFVVGSADRLTLDLVEPDDGAAIAHIGREAYGIWTVVPTQIGFVVGGATGPMTLAETVHWERPVRTLDAALAIISGQAADIHAHVTAIAHLVAKQGVDAINSGGRLT